MGDEVLVSNLPGVLTVVGVLLSAVSFGILAIFKGWLIPVSTHKQQVELLTQQLASVTHLLNARIADVTTERETWRSVARDFETVNAEVRAQNRMLLEQGRTATYAIDQIRRALDQIGAVLAAGVKPGDAEAIRGYLEEIRATMAAGSTEGVTT
jgi:acetolactate synthase small subunit